MGIGCKEEIGYIKKNINSALYILPLIVASIFEVICYSWVNSLGVFWRLTLKTIVLFGMYYILLAIKKEEIIGIGIQSIKKIVARNKYHKE